MSNVEETVGAKPASAAGLTIALCFAVMVIEGFDIQALGVAAPALGPELGLSRETLGQALSSANIGLVFGAIAGGWMADLFGRKPVLIAAVVTFGLFTLGTIVADSFETLFAARLLTGLGFGAALPNVMAIAADMSRADKSGSTAAMMFCGMPVGGCAVALISWLSSDADWRLLFMIGGVIPLILAPVMMFFMKETSTPQKLDSQMAQLLSWVSALPFGFVAFLLLVQIGRLPGAGSIAGVAPWLGGVMGILGGYMIVHREALFGGGRTWPSLLLWLIFFPTLVILYLVLNWLPTLVGAKGFADDASLSAVLFNAFSVVGALGFGFLVDRFGLRWPLIGCFAGLVFVLIALAQSDTFFMVMFLSGAVGFFLLGANYALYGAAAGYYPAEMRGRGSGAAIAWGRLGAVAGPLVGGYLLQGGAQPGEVVYAMVPFAVVAAVGVGLLTMLSRTEA